MSDETGPHQGGPATAHPRAPKWRRPSIFLPALAAVVVAVLVVGLLVRPPTESDEASRESPSPGAETEAPTEGPTAPVERPTVAQAERLGLHYTDLELAIWRERAEEGPYREDGDVSDHSPGDWERITDNTEAFVDDPEDSHWAPDFDGCIPGNERYEPSMSKSDEIRDAAFYALVEDDEELGRAVVEQLVDQAEEELADFSDDDRFCPDEVKDSHPHYVLAQWMTKMLYAFDYVKQWAEDDEAETLRAWFDDAAGFLLPETQAVFDRLFADRSDGDYTPTNEASFEGVGFYGSQETTTYSRHYSNRWGNIMRYIGLVGVEQSNDEYIAAAKQWGKEFLMFAVYPDGWISEFQRWLPNDESAAGHELGYTYAANMIGQMISLADALARTGDTELYDYVTAEGLYGTEGGSKSIEFAIESMAHHLDGTHERYGTDASNLAGEDDYRIDSIFDDGEYYSVHDVMLAPANLYYRNRYIREMYTRTGEGMPPYPGDEAINGSHPVWAGESGTLPGVLFMFGQTEELVDPYP